MTLHSTTLDALCALLENGDEADRCHVARTFGALQEPAAFPALVKRLHDDDIDVCVDAVEALGRLGDPAAITPLLASLRGDPSGEVRVAAVTALGGFNDPRVVEALIEVVARRPADLEQEGDWDYWWDMQRHAVTALGRLRASEAVPTLVALLDSEEGEEIEGETLRVLTRLGILGMEVLSQRLIGGSLRQRCRAAWALGHVDGRATLPLLAKGLLDSDPEVRIAVLEALARRQAGRYLPAALLALKDRSAAVRAKATEAVLALAGTTDAARGLVVPLRELLDDPEPRVRQIVLTCLSRLTDAQAALDLPEALLHTALGDPDPEVAIAACTLSGKVGGAALSDDLLRLLGDAERPAMLRREAALALGAAGWATGPVVAALRVAVTDPESAVRLGAMTALMRLAGAPRDRVGDDAGTADPLEVILAIVRDGVTPAADDAPDAAEPVTPLRAGAVADSQAGLVGEAADPAGEQVETDAPGAAVPEVNSTLAAIAMDNVETMLHLAGEGAGKDAPDSLAAAAENDAELRPFVEIVQRNLARATARKRTHQVTVGTEVRRLGVHLLGDCDTPAAVAALTGALLDPDPELSREAAAALGRVARRNPSVAGLADAFGALVTRLGLGQPDQQVACMRALSALGQRAALIPLVERLDDTDPGVRAEAIRSVGELLVSAQDRAQDAAVHTRLLFALDDSDPGVRAAAAAELVRLQAQDAGGGTTAETLVDRLIEAALRDEGLQARTIGRTLRRLGPNVCNAQLVRRLDAVETSQQRRFVLEMIEELHRQEPPAARLAAA